MKESCKTTGIVLVSLLLIFAVFGCEKKEGTKQDTQPQEAGEVTPITAEQKYKITWRSKITGFQGHGEWMSENSTRAALKQGEREWGEFITHELEKKS